MKKQIATLFILFFSFSGSIYSTSLKVNMAYDYFRGLPDGTWNGKHGALVGANLGISFFDFLGLQAGGSYGIYNWEGNRSEFFQKQHQMDQQTFLTAGLFTKICGFNAGMVYDRLFTRHYTMFGVNPNLDQLRFQAGYLLGTDEIGFWGTSRLEKSEEKTLGIPLKFKAIGQINFFWTHYFSLGATTSIFAGLPYEQRSLKFPHRRSGNFIAGFSVSAPLTECFFIEGNGSYMRTTPTENIARSHHNGANVCIGITYLLSDSYRDTPYLPIANHSNFLIDTNINKKFSN